MRGRLNPYLAALLLGLGLLACGRESVQDPDGAGEFRSMVEGMIHPVEPEATVTLTRGGDTLLARTRDGYFQLRDVDFGLYVLEARAEGRGGFRRTLEVGARHARVPSIFLSPEPWPMSLVQPGDSLVLRSDSRDSTVRIYFARRMDRAAVEEALRFSPEVPHSLHWSDYPDTDDLLGEIFAITVHPSGMRLGEAYEMTLGQGVRTAEGHPMEGVFRYRLKKASLPADRPFFAEVGNPGALEPMDTVVVVFSEAMDTASVAAALRLEPESAHERIWGPDRRTLHLVPETRWRPDEWLAVSLEAGYRTSQGREGRGMSETLRLREFRLTAPDWSRPSTLARELDLVFNLPVDPASLRYRLDPGITASAAALSPERIRLTLSGTAEGETYTLRLDSAVSGFGDSLAGPVPIRFTARPGPSSFRILDSLVLREGLLPTGDTLRLAATWSAWQRLKDRAFIAAPGHPVTARWSVREPGVARLTAVFPQPVPADTLIRLFPTSGAEAGDTLAFRTAHLAGAYLRPFQGETRVPAGEPLVLEWNTLIDTADFAARLTVTPPLDEPAISHAVAGGRHRTTIRHAGFTRGTAYRVAVGGVTDLFSQTLRDSLITTFRSAP